MRYFLAILLLFSTAFAADTVINTNKVVLGQKSSASDKLLEFQINAGAANPKIKVNPATAKLQFTNDGTNYKDIGSGGSGSKNFAIFGDAEAGLGTTAAYADVAGTSPVDGTGGSPVATIAISGTTPLENLNSFIFTKDAANRQGNGFSVPFTIDSQQKAKVLNISFKYLVNSGTFVAGTSSADSDVTVWIYDVTNAQLIQPSSYKLLSNSSTIADVFNATFQTSSSSTSYRLIFHIGTTSASAYSLKIDDIQVSPSNYAYGTPITDWQAYTPAFNGFGTPTGVECFNRRVGDSSEISCSFTAGTTTAVEARVGLPSGQTSANTSRIPTIQKVGDLAYSVNAANSYEVLVEPSVTYMVIGIQSATTNGLTKVASASGAWSSGARFSIKALVPIQGWSSSVQTSDQTDTRFVGFRARRSTAATAITGTTGVDYDVVYNLVDYDSHGAYNSTTGVFTAPVSGYYKCDAGVNYAANATTTGFRAIMLKKNGTSVAQKRPAVISATNLPYPNVNDILFLNAGDTLKAAVNQNSGVTIGLEQSDANVNVENIFACARQSGANQISATESVYASYYQASVQTAFTALTIISFDTKVEDSHGAFTTGASSKFTAPISGRYRVSYTVTSGSVAWTSGNTFLCTVYKNGAARTGTPQNSSNAQSTGTYRIVNTNYDIVNLLSGDFIDLRCSSSVSQQPAAASGVYISVERIGN